MLAAVHELRLQTRWTDFDALGHITHAAYPMYLDEGRDAVLTATVGPFTEFAWVIAHVSIDYKREIVLGTREVIVRSSIAEVGRTSVTFEQEVLDPGGNIAVVCTSVLVAWDRAERAARPIDERERALLLV
jgi:YbgC/YbaW family acyl-CoA thioester hydrolase